MTLYYEDIQCGDSWTVGEYTMTKTEIIDFAEQFDPQAQHTDEEAAKDSMFGELVASGLHTLSVSVRLFILELDQIANIAGLGLDKIRWHEPVTPGMTLSLRVEVLEKSQSTSRTDRGYITTEREVITDDGTTVLSYIVHTIVLRRPDEEDS